MMNAAQREMIAAATEGMTSFERLLLARRLACSVEPSLHEDLRTLGNHLSRHADFLERAFPTSAGAQCASVGEHSILPDQLPLQSAGSKAMIAGASFFPKRLQFQLPFSSHWIGDVIGALCLCGFAYILVFFAGVLSS